MVATTKWFILLGDGKVCGPFSECQIRNGIQSQKIHDAMRVRQGQSDWIRVEKVRKLFEGLDVEGVYVRDEENRVHGPFTQSRFHAMQAANELPSTYEIRHGRNGEWITSSRQVDATPTSKVMPLRMAPTQHGADGLEHTRTSVGVDPSALPAIPPAPVMKLRTWSWINAVTGVCSRFENIVLGDPLTGNS